MRRIAAPSRLPAGRRTSKIVTPESFRRFRLQNPANQEHSMKRVIAGGDDGYGTGTALSSLAPDYDGPCRMTYGRLPGAKRFAVFPNPVEARLAANYAVQVDRGGFSIAELTMATPQEVTHLSCIEWICFRDGNR
jgi:hypothetical protein